MNALTSTSGVLAETSWPTVSLIVFLALFMAIVIYVFAVPNSIWKKDARLPLDDQHSEHTDKENPRG